jgi:DNA-binding PadR family transcriptional regulator
MPRTQRLNDFELMLLLATLRVDDAYGVRIAREVERTTGRRVLMGAAYTALDRLEQRGLVSSALGDPTPERGGRAKRYFRVTSRGVDAVRQTRRALETLWTGVSQLGASQLKEKRT